MLLLFSIFLTFAVECQTINSENFKILLAGKWTRDYCDTQWKITEGPCFDTLIFETSGLINSTEHYINSEFFTGDTPTDTVYFNQEKWIQFDEINQKISFLKFNTEENAWPDMTKTYEVVSITENQIDLEYLHSVPVKSKDNNSVTLIIRIRLTRIKENTHNSTYKK